jgi:hypothetical protein
VRKHFLPVVVVCLGLVSFAATASPLFAKTRIEAVKGKLYPLSKENGPWMIMITSLWGELPEQKVRAEQASHELVFELRALGIPAYSFKQEGHLDELETLDRYGKMQKRYFAAQRDSILVVAGNYPSVEDDRAQKTLKYIKQLRPKCLEPVAKLVPGGKSPLHRAFLTRNPLLPDDVKSQKVADPLLLRLNSGIEHSLFQNPHKYSLVVASFNGKSQVDPAKFQEFEKKLATEVSLDSAGEESWRLAKALRARNVQAYVAHERYRSIVTVGGFDSPNDPEIGRLIQQYGAKYKAEAKTGNQALFAEFISLPGRRPNDPPLKSWILDANPELIEVPRLK